MADGSVVSINRPFSFAGIGNLLLNETEKLNILKVANRGYTLQFLFSAVNDTFS